MSKTAIVFILYFVFMSCVGGAIGVVITNILLQKEVVYCTQDCCPLDCQDSDTCTAYCCDGVSKHNCKSPCCNGEPK